MENIDDKVKTLISKEQIEKRIEEIASNIEEDYKGKNIVVIGILKGAVYFAVDLTKKIKNNVIMDFMKVSSYGNETKSSGKVELKLDLSVNIEGKDVIIVEDIIDSGTTLKYLKEYLGQKNPNSIRICVLLDKKERRVENVEVDYVGFEISNKFVVGYGLDYEDGYRNLPYIAYIDI